MDHGRDRPQTALRPESGVEINDGRFVARCEEPWLAFEKPTVAEQAGRFIEIIYRASLLDEPARPIFRFRCRDGSVVDRIAAAPVCGTGIWIGLVPTGTIGFSVSPTTRLGPFDFRIEIIRRRFWPALLVKGFRTRPRAARSALLTRLIGWTAESDVNLAWSISSTPLANYDAWSAVRARKLDLTGFDRPRLEWPAAPSIRVIVIGHDPAGLDRTVAGLMDQVFPHWTAIFEAKIEHWSSRDVRLTMGHETPVIERLREDDSQVLTCVLRSGDVLFPHALAYVAEQRARCPDVQLFYGDALHASGQGKTAPCFQPGWSPRLHAAGLGPGPPLFVRNLKAWPEEPLQCFLRTGRLQSSALTGLPACHVKALRRVLVTTTVALDHDKVVSKACVSPPPDAMAAIVVLTRDHAALLRRAIASIGAKSRRGRYRIIIVDNGSVTTEARALLKELGKSPDISLLDYPGRFDFSSMCNQAAASAKADVLVFLNDDTEILSDDWLDRLMAHALDPTIGAVGAKLTYPSGLIQHVGVLVGMGESAGHFGSLDSVGSSGWAGRNNVVHEVSAVTGACLAVERRKFEAIGGFDAERLPVELSDIDLCLRLNAHGWQTVVDPDVHLMHEESASRGGATFRRLDVYADQRAAFVERWRHVLRDDPFFHPGLSLYSSKAALG